jgi:signal transduction histidine kinase
LPFKSSRWGLEEESDRFAAPWHANRATRKVAYVMRLSAFITANVRIIVDDWEQFARTLLPASETMDSLGLRDHAKQILLAIAKDIATWQSVSDSVDKSQGNAFRADSVVESAAELHGSLRQRHGFTMIQLAAEFRALRGSVLRLWGSRSQETVPYAEDIQRFNEAIDQALAESIDRFTLDVDRGRNLFLGILGHDIKTPLNAVTLTAQVLARRHLDDEPELKLLRRIQRNVATISTVITDLLEFVRLDLGKEMVLNRQMADFEVLAAAAIDDSQATFPEADIRLSADGDTLGLWDEIRIRQLLRTLIRHALSSSTRDTPVIMHIRRNREDLVVKVEHVGEELPATVLSSLFNPMVREASAGTASDGIATLGLDLYIGREIVLAHQGSISAASTANRNSVTAILPLEVASDSALSALAVPP